MGLDRSHLFSAPYGCPPLEIKGSHLTYFPDDEGYVHITCDDVDHKYWFMECVNNEWVRYQPNCEGTAFDTQMTMI
jgi:hypothetical protein